MYIYLAINNSYTVTKSNNVLILISVINISISVCTSSGVRLNNK